MNTLLSFVSIWEYLLRYTVIIGVIFAIFGAALCMMAKRITMAVRNTETIDKRDKLYTGLMMGAIALILVGMIIIALPIDATLYIGG